MIDFGSAFSFEVSGPHNHLIKMMKALGYQSSDAGVCYGISHMGIQAVLSNDIESFNNRLDYILNLNPEDMVTFREELIERKSQSLPITERDQVVIDILAFFDGIELYFQARKYPHLYEDDVRPKTQDAYLTSPLLLSKSIEEEGQGLTRISQFSGVYTQAELADYFKELRESLPTGSPPIALSLNTTHHSISVGYDGKNWIFIDANQMPAKFISSTSDNEIADKVIQGFLQKDYEVFSTELYVTNRNASRIIDNIRGWEYQQKTKLQSLSAEKINARDTFGSTWLSVAAQYGYLEEVSDLLAKSVSVDKKDISLPTQNGHYAIVDMLLNHGIDPNFEYRGVTPLISAVQSGDVDLVNSLIKAKADLKLRNSLGQTPFMYAFMSDDIRMVELLLEQAPDLVNEQYASQSALYTAAYLGSIKSVQRILNLAPHLLNQPTINGDVPLMSAASHNQLEIFKYLVMQQGIDFNARNSDGKTALHWAAENGHHRISAEIVNNDSFDKNVRDNDGRTALMVAAEKGQISVVAQLLKSENVNRNFQDNNGRTALYLAIRAGNLEIARMLMSDPSVNIEIPSNSGINIVTLAAIMGHRQLLYEILDSQRINPDPNALLMALELTANLGKELDIDTVQKLMNHENVDPNIKSKSNATVVNLALLYCPLEIVFLIISCNRIDLNLKDGNGRSALSQAVWARKHTVVEQLLTNNNIDVNDVDGFGMTPLLRAVHGGDYEMVILLLKHKKIDLFKTNFEGDTALSLAVKNGHDKIATLLNSKMALKESSATRSSMIYRDVKRLPTKSSVEKSIAHASKSKHAKKGRTRPKRSL